MLVPAEVTISTSSARAQIEGDVELGAGGATVTDVASTLIAAAVGAKTMLPTGAGYKAYASALGRRN